MAQIETLLRDHLVGNVSVAALLATRIYPLVIPQTATLPAASYQVIDRIEVQARPEKVTVRLMRMRIQFDIYASSYASVKAAEAAMIQAIYGFNHTVSNAVIQTRVVDQRDAVQEEEASWHSSLDASITFNE
jgi:hypothetical protein